MKVRAYSRCRQSLSPIPKNRVGNRSASKAKAPRFPSTEVTCNLGEVPIRTMVINDSLDILDELSRFLLVQPGIELAGFSDDAEESLDEVGALRPQLVVLGLHMHGRDSFQTTNELRRKFPAIGIIVTGTTKKCSIANRCRSEGADAFVAKKHLRRDLLPAIQRAVAEHAL